MMKKIFGFATVLLLATSCYDDFVKDFDKTGIYIAYQYDLRTFVLGETETIKLPVALGGLMENNKDRNVKVVFDDELLTADISTIIPLSETSVFAINGMKGTATVGQMSAEYVATTINAAGVKALSPLPEGSCGLAGHNALTIKKGDHTAFFTLTAKPAFADDPKAFAPNYAVAYRIVSADADTVLADKSFSVVAIKCENRFYGTWRRTGSIKNYSADGTLVSEDSFEDSWNDANAYTLTTVDASTLTCNKAAGASKAMKLTFEGNSITISSADGLVSGTGSFNGAKLLQDRTLTLNYRVTAANGSYTEASEVLLFRNRIRDGISEWQDENPENYK